MNERMINKAIKKLGLFIFPYGLAIVSACITLFQCADNNFWGDESYTILMVNGAKSFIDVATCDIANPPFFFLIFKLFTLILGKKILGISFCFCTSNNIVTFVQCYMCKEELWKCTS